MNRRDILKAGLLTLPMWPVARTAPAATPIITPDETPIICRGWSFVGITKEYRGPVEFHDCTFRDCMLSFFHAAHVERCRFTDSSIWMRARGRHRFVVNHCHFKGWHRDSNELYLNMDEFLPGSPGRNHPMASQFCHNHISFPPMTNAEWIAR
jgi:hypothetical protein